MLGLKTFAASLLTGLPLLFAPSPASVQSDGLRVDGPYTHENLSIYVVSGGTEDARRFITLAEGLKKGSVRLREKGAGADASVNELEIENFSDEWLYLQAGDVIVGGRQDRTIGVDAVIPPHSGRQPIAAFCVEHGRWTPRGDATKGRASAFADNTAIAGSNAMKMSIQGEADQSRVWAEVARDEKRAAAKLKTNVAASTGTYDAIVSNEKLAASRADYLGILLPRIEKTKDAVGLVVAIDGRVQSADVYGSSALFHKLARKLLESYAQEALLSPQSAVRPAAPSVDEARSFLQASATGAREKSEKVAESTTRTTIRKEQTVVFEYTSREREAGQKTLLHRNYVRD
jgi:hypothetical protein